MKPMKKIDTYIYKLGLWAGAALSLTACVDEDLSDCPPNVEMREITVSYQIDLQHGVDPEFEAELLSLTDSTLAKLRAMTDAEFDKLELYLDYDK